MDKIIQIISNNNLQRRLVKYGLLRVREMFSFLYMIIKYLEICESYKSKSSYVDNIKKGLRIEIK